MFKFNVEFLFTWQVIHQGAEIKQLMTVWQYALICICVRHLFPMFSIYWYTVLVISQCTIHFCYKRQFDVDFRVELPQRNVRTRLQLDRPAVATPMIVLY